MWQRSLVTLSNNDLDLASFILTIPKKFAPICNLPPPFQAPCHPCIYAINEEHFAAYRELRYYVVLRLVG
jgi:hypothetical protein